MRRQLQFDSSFKVCGAGVARTEAAGAIQTGIAGHEGSAATVSAGVEKLARSAGSCLDHGS